MAETNDVQERAFAKATGQQILRAGDEYTPAAGIDVIDENDPLLGTPPGTPEEKPVGEAENPQELEVYNKFFEKKFGKKEDEVKALLSRKPIEDEVQERLGRPLTEVEEFLKNPPKSVEFETDLLKSHQAFLKAGGTEADWRKSLVVQDRLVEMSHDELAKHGLKLKHPDLSAEDINNLFKHLYKIPAPLDPDKYAEEEVAERNADIETAKLLLKVDAEEIRKAELAKSVKALDTPVSRETQLSPAEVAKQEALRKEATELMNEARSKFSARKGIEVEITEGEKGKETVSKVNYDLTPDERKIAEQILQSPQSFFLSMFTEAGKLDPGKWEKTAALIAGGERAITEMAKDFAHAKLEAYIKGLTNANFKPGEMRVAPTTDQAKRNKELADKQMGRA